MNIKSNKYIKSSKLIQLINEFDIFLYLNDIFARFVKNVLISWKVITCSEYFDLEDIKLRILNIIA